MLLELDEDVVVIVVVVLYHHQYGSTPYIQRTYVVGPSYIGGTPSLLELGVDVAVVVVLCHR
jgi:hypothetical protein